MNDHQRGIYQPGSDGVQVYDLEDDDGDDEERSRLPLMIVVAFVVLAAFTGVVWLAYNQGVARGRSGASVVINAPDGPVRTAPAEAGGGTPFTGLKIYSQPVPPDQEAQNSTVASAAPAPPAPRVVSAAPAPAPRPEAAAEAPSLRTATPAPTVEVPKAPTAAPQPAAAPAAAPPPSAVAQAARPAPQPVPAAPPPAAAPPPRPAAPAQTAQAAPPPAAPRPLQAAPPPPAPSAPAAASSAVAGGAVLQIGAFESEALANGAWNAFKTRHAEIVGSLSQDIQKADLPRGTFYRLRVGPFKDRAAAVAACEKLKAKSASCLVAAP